MGSRWVPAFTSAWCPTCGWSRRDDSTSDAAGKLVRAAALRHVKAKGHRVHMERGASDILDPADFDGVPTPRADGCREGGSSA